MPAGGLWEIDVKAQGCSVEIAPGDPGSQVSVVLERKNDQKLQLEVYQEEEELKIRATKRGLIPSAKQDAVLRVSIPSDYRGGFSFEGNACSAVLRDINFSGEIDLELSACDLQGSAFRERRFPSPLPPLPSPFSGFAGSWIWSRAWATPA